MDGVQWIIKARRGVNEMRAQHCTTTSHFSACWNVGRAKHREERNHQSNKKWCSRFSLNHQYAQSSTTEYSNKGKSKGGRGATIFISSGRLSSFSHSFPSAFRTCTRVASGIDSVTSPTPNIGTNGVVSYKTRRFSLSRWTRVKTQPWLLIDRPYG